MNAPTDLSTARAAAVSSRAPQDDIPAQHWQGGPVDCAGCTYAALRHLEERQGCEPGYACMQDIYARRIDRFFRWHPALCDAQLAHPYFEVRAIAARFASVFRLSALMDDPDETVRLQVALRVPQALLSKLVCDPHREVRIRVALRLPTPLLVSMRDDPDYGVRELVAQRLPQALLAAMAHDRDRAVRLRVAQRLDMPALLRMAGDSEAQVRCLVAERLPIGLLSTLAQDADWRVRYAVAQRANAQTLETLQDDTEPDVRQLVAERLNPPAVALVGEHTWGEVHG
jgi:LRV protein FeS4 cluster/Leucine rich repeat variant